MSPFLAFGAGLVIAFMATRAARRSARATELRLLTAYLARHAKADARPHPARGSAAAYLAEAQESLEAELRKVRNETAPPLYTPEQARAARAALEPGFGIRMRVKP